MATITPAPSLVRRDNYVWGYVSGDSNSPLSCPGSFTPTIGPGGAYIIECCDQATCTDAWHLCNPFLGTFCPDTSVCSEVYGDWVQCDVNAPSCITYVLVTGPNDNAVGRTSYGCGATGGVLKVLSTSTTPGAAIAQTTNLFATSTGANSINFGSGSSTGNGGSPSGSSSSLLSSASKIDEYVGIGLAVVLGLWMLWFFIKMARKWSNDRQKARHERADPSRYAETEYDFRMAQFMRDRPSG